jgi:phage-related protein (TIGR01555 family)
MSRRNRRGGQKAAATTSDRRRTSSSDSLQNLVAGLGDARDKASYSRYVMGRVIEQQELETLYRTNWIAGKVVDIPAADMTRAWVTRKTALTDEQMKPFYALEKRLKLKAKVRDALAWGRLYGGSAIFIHVKGQDPKSPLDPATVQQGANVSLHVFDRYRATRGGGSVVQDPISEMFGQPDTFRIAGTSLEVHHSRMIQFQGAELPWQQYVTNGYWHDSAIQRLYDSLTRYDTVTQGTASMFFEAVVDVLKVAGLGEMLSTDEGTDLVKKRFGLAAMMKSFNRVLLIDGNDDHSQKTNSFAGVKDVIQQFMSDIAGGADIPATRLFGKSPDGMNASGDSDTRNYYDRVSADQEDKVRPPLELLDEVIFRASIGVYPDDLETTFNPLWQMSDTEKAALEKTRADRDAVYLTNGVVSEGVVAAELLENGTYSKMTPRDVELAKQLAGPVDDPDADPAATIEAPGSKDPATQVASDPAQPIGGGVVQV